MHRPSIFRGSKIGEADNIINIRFVFNTLIKIWTMYITTCCISYLKMLCHTFMFVGFLPVVLSSVMKIMLCWVELKWLAWTQPRPFIYFILEKLVYRLSEFIGLLLSHSLSLPGQLTCIDSENEINPKLWVALSGGRVVVFDASSWSMLQNCIQVGMSKLVRTNTVLYCHLF